MNGAAPPDGATAGIDFSECEREPIPLSPDLKPAPLACRTPRQPERKS